MISNQNFGLKENEISEIKNIFEFFTQIKKVLIYGSRARGDFRFNSDIDFCLTDEIDFDLYLKIFGKLNDLEIPYIFDLVRINKIDYLVKENILKDSVVFYEKT